MIDSSPTSPTLEELIGRPVPPPLRIHHIMVATAVVALLLSISNALRQSNSFGFSTFAVSGSGITMAITSGLAATLVGFGFSWRRRGYSFFDHPGHWLLLTQSLMVGFFVVAAVIGALQLPDTHVVTSAAISVFFVLLNVVGIGLNLWAATKIADSIPWTLIFLIDGLTVVCLIGMEILGLSRFVPLLIWGAPIAMLALLLLAALDDRRDHIRRDWPHWLGVFLRLVSSLQILGRPIWVWVLARPIWIWATSLLSA